jgi:hypothetical protein
VNAGARSQASQPARAIRQVSILASPDSPRRIGGWQTLLRERVGAGSHELAASAQVQAPYRWGKPAPAQIGPELWRPVPPKAMPAATPDAMPTPPPTP